MTAALVRLLRFASIVICVIVAAAFVVFAANQTKTASGHQQEQLSSEAPGGHPVAQHGPAKEGSLHKALDEASNELTSPFAGVVSGSKSEWTIHGVKLLLALLVYGFGLGYIARVLRVRV